MDIPTLQVTNVNTDSITYAWDAIAEATGYVLQYDNAGWIEGWSGTDTAGALTSLSPYTQYNTRVGVTDGAEWLYSDAISTYTYLDVPSSISAACNETSITISWSSAPGSEGTSVFRDGTLLARVQGNGFDQSYEDVERIPGVTYSYTLQSYLGNDANGYNDWGNQSSAIEATIPLPQLGTPGFSSITIDTTTITLSWDSISGAETYQVDYSIDGGDTWNSVGNTENTTLDLLNCVTGVYDFRIVASGTGYPDSETGYGDFTYSIELEEDGTLFIDGSIIVNTSRIIVTSIANCIY